MTDAPSDELNLDVIELTALDGRTHTETLRGLIGTLTSEVRRLRAAAGVSVLSQDGEEK